jgi:hypothetical protein
MTELAPSFDRKVITTVHLPTDQKEKFNIVREYAPYILAAYRRVNPEDIGPLSDDKERAQVEGVLHADHFTTLRIPQNENDPVGELAAIFAYKFRTREKDTKFFNRLTISSLDQLQPFLSTEHLEKLKQKNIRIDKIQQHLDGLQAYMTTEEMIVAAKHKGKRYAADIRQFVLNELASEEGGNYDTRGLVVIGEMVDTSPAVQRLKFPANATTFWAGTCINSNEPMLPNGLTLPELEVASHIVGLAHLQTHFPRVVDTYKDGIFQSEVFEKPGRYPSEENRAKLPSTIMDGFNRIRKAQAQLSEKNQPVILSGMGVTFFADLAGDVV